MEKVIQKLARQLNQFDEASLMALWDKYASIVENFEPSKRWEEAVLMLSMIQSVRFKNQLFNHHWSKSGEPAPDIEMVTRFDEDGDPEPMTESSPEPSAEKSDGGPSGRDSSGKGGKVLAFRPRKD